MELVLFIGIQAAGKSTFFRERFFNTHIRINLDMLKTRHREQLLVSGCITAKQPFVVDNTNPTAEERARYIAPAKAARFRVVGYYFASPLQDAIQRNAARSEAQRIPERGLLATHAKLELPKRSEGFDALCYVSIAEAGGFTVEEWKDEV
jgi:predicted kinase